MSANIQAVADRGSRGGQDGRGVSSRLADHQKTVSPEFDRRCRELKGCLINCGQAKHADYLSHTMKEIIDNAGSNITDGERMDHWLRTEKVLLIT